MGVRIFLNRQITVPQHMGVLMLGLTVLCELLFALVKVTSFTVLSNTPSKGVVMIDRLGFDNLIVLILRPQAFLKLVVGVVL